MFTSEDSGLGCLANSRSLAERRSFRAASAGPKTFLTRRLLLAFLVLARALFAIFVDMVENGCLSKSRYQNPLLLRKKSWDKLPRGSGEFNCGGVWLVKQRSTERDAGILVHSLPACARDDRLLFLDSGATTL